MSHTHAHHRGKVQCKQLHLLIHELVIYLLVSVDSFHHHHTLFSSSLSFLLSAPLPLSHPLCTPGFSLSYHLSYDVCSAIHYHAYGHVKNYYIQKIHYRLMASDVCEFVIEHYIKFFLFFCAVHSHTHTSTYIFSRSPSISLYSFTTLSCPFVVRCVLNTDINEDVNLND